MNTKKKYTKLTYNSSVKINFNLYSLVKNNFFLEKAFVFCKYCLTEVFYMLYF